MIQNTLQNTLIEPSSIKVKYCSKVHSCLLFGRLLNNIHPMKHYENLLNIKFHVPFIPRLGILAFRDIKYMFNWYSDLKTSITETSY